MPRTRCWGRVPPDAHWNWEPGENLGESGTCLGVRRIDKLQDHASGSLLVEECGGIITDSRGKPLNFGLGRTLGENHGVIAAGKDIHARILAVVQQALAEAGRT